MFRSRNDDSQYIRKTVAGLLLIAFSSASFSACQTVETAAPELKDPIVLPDNYLKPDHGDIGVKQYVAGTIIPRMEPVFVESLCSLEKMHVKVGDKVKAGDLIASGVPTDDTDLESVNSRISALGKRRQINS